MRRFLSVVSTLAVAASILATAVPTAASAQNAGPTPTDVQSFTATADGSTVSLSAQIDFGGQAPVLLGTDAVGDAPPNGIGLGSGLGLDLTAIRAYRAAPDGPVTMEWQTTQLDRLPPPEVVRHHWQFLADGEAPFSVQAKTTDVVSATNLGDGQATTIAGNLTSYTEAGVPSFRLSGNCGFIGGVNSVSNCGHVAWVTGEFDFAADVVRLHLPVGLAAAAAIRPGASLAPDTKGAYSEFQLATDLAPTRDTVLQANTYVIPDSIANVSLVDAAGTVVTSTSLSAGQDGSWTGSLTAPAPGTYTANLSACFANNCDTATSQVVTTQPPDPLPPRTGIWISAPEIAALPASGPAWNQMKADADAADYGNPSLLVRDKHNVHTLAAAFVGAKLGSSAYKTRVRDELRAMVNANLSGTDILGVCRKLGAYVIAADVIDLRTFDPGFGATFDAFLATILIRDFGGTNVITHHERRANNHGTQAGFSRLAVAAYLGDYAQIYRVAQVLRGWVGERDIYASFTYGSLEWQADPSAPVGINPVGAQIMVDGALRNVDGVLPDDQRRGAFTWPPPKENYVWGGLAGVLPTAVMLARQGYTPWDWSSQAIKRAVVWLHDVCNFPAVGDDTWQPWIVNDAYGATFPAPTPSNTGKLIGYSDWTHG